MAELQPSKLATRVRFPSPAPSAIHRARGFAVVAQLVERHLAKVEVASPSLVYRSTKSRRWTALFSYMYCFSNKTPYVPPQIQAFCSLCVLVFVGKTRYVLIRKEDMIMDQVKIGSFLKTLRNEKGLTQEQLAEKVNVSRRSVSRWETGVSHS